MSLIRFPLALPPQAKPRRRPRWRAFWGFVVLVALVLFLVYGLVPALEAWLSGLESRIAAIRQPRN